jgi:hypothetical protein
MAAVRPCADDVLVERASTAEPAVHCRDCNYEWHSPAMADGLRLLGTCPKCGGELVFAAAQAAHEAPASPIMDGRAPHLVLGVPRR